MRLAWVVVLGVVFGFVPATEAAEPARPSLLQLANAYRETERAISLFPPSGQDEIIACNREMDRVAIHFFTRDYGKAIQAMHSVMLSRVRGPNPNASDRLALALNRNPNLSVLVRGGDDWPPKLELVPQYALDHADIGNVKVKLSVSRRGSSAHLETELGIKVTEGPVVTCEYAVEEWLKFWNAPELAPGTFDLEIQSEHGIVGRSIPWEILDEPLRSKFDRLQKRFAALKNDPTSDHPRTLWQSRLALLDPDSPQFEITRWAIGTSSLLSAIEQELDSLEQGQDPYHEFMGDIWLSLRVQGGAIPCRIYRPTNLAKGQPHPLVIALHGAGGNEHMFMETLGAGRIKQLADREGFIVVSPSTLAVMSQQSAFVDFIEQVNLVHPIQEDKVSLIGHSMGAFTATQLGSLFPDRIRSMALIAGGPRWGLVKKSFPRTRVYLAENDAIVPSKPIAKSVTGCQRMGIPIDFVDIPNVGHVLVVSAVLDEAVMWLCE